MDKFELSERDQKDINEINAHIRNIAAISHDIYFLRRETKSLIENSIREAHSSKRFIHIQDDSTLRPIIHSKFIIEPTWFGIKGKIVIENFDFKTGIDYENFFPSKNLKQLTEWKAEHKNNFSFCEDTHILPNLMTFTLKRRIIDERIMSELYFLMLDFYHINCLHPIFIGQNILDLIQDSKEQVTEIEQYLSLCTKETLRDLYKCTYAKFLNVIEEKEERPNMENVLSCYALNLARQIEDGITNMWNRPHRFMEYRTLDPIPSFSLISDISKIGINKGIIEIFLKRFINYIKGVVAYAWVKSYKNDSDWSDFIYVPFNNCLHFVQIDG